MNIAVYCGSSSGNNLRFIESARILGKWIGENGHTLVYGGANKGLMGAVAVADSKVRPYTKLRSCLDYEV